MTVEEMIEYWIRSAEEDVKTAEALFSAKRYLPCLFYCHLFVEKILKALVVKKTREPAPYGHKLPRLAKITSVDFTQEQMDFLANLTTFNVRARYEDYKFKIYKQATENYTKQYIQKAKEFYLWLKKNL